MSTVRIPLVARAFCHDEMTIAETEDFVVSGFQYPAGVAGLRVVNRRGEFVVLPFQGQQIWDARFDGRRLTMKSMFEQPRRTNDFLRNYGALLIHCGITAVGPPGPQDNHPPHGELPNADFDDAWFEFHGDRIAVCGSYRHTVAFQTDYVFLTRIGIGANGAVFDVDISVENKKRSSMDLFYLAHVNFRAADCVSITDNASSYRIRADLPSHVTPGLAFLEMVARLKENPAEHLNIASGSAFDPEIVLYPQFENQEAVAIATHTDGSSDVIRYQTKQLRHALRWISKTPDQECLGLSLPATCEGEGLRREIQKGHAIEIEPQGTWCASYSFGLIDPAETAQVRTELSATPQREVN